MGGYSQLPSCSSLKQTVLTADISTVAFHSGVAAPGYYYCVFLAITSCSFCHKKGNCKVTVGSFQRCDGHETLLESSVLQTLRVAAVALLCFD